MITRPISELLEQMAQVAHEQRALAQTLEGNAYEYVAGIADVIEEATRKLDSDIQSLADRLGFGLDQRVQ